MADTLTPAYRAVVAVSHPIVSLWGRLRVEGHEHVPEEGPVLLVANHDSYWDTVTVAVAARRRRQIHALAKAQLWSNRLVGAVLNGMGQIPIERGKGDVAAMQRAIDGLRSGLCIGIFPEGTRSLGRELRARSGVGRLAEAVPEAAIVCVAVTGTTDVPRFPKRPRLGVRFFPPSGGGLQPGESHAEFAARLLAEIRAIAPRQVAGRRRRAPADAAA
ncbi:MAG: 1-acyl-sn-glycerol-3-phosphate acyltransferase [Solirubrobacteraceae bacterium]|nr:1-acyl-sn-glycerol-3-phosphate acyltransferase [Solirubrobacteraceae bacterium]